MDILSIILFCILLVLLPLGQVFRIPVGNSVFIDPLDIGIFLLAIITWIKVIVTRQKPPKIFFIFGIFTLSGFIALCLQIPNLSLLNFTVSFLYLLRLVLYATLGIGVWLLNKNQKNLLLKVLLISGGIILVAGYVQYFFFPSLRGLLYEGWDPHFYRMFTTFLDPNFAGVFFTLYFLLVLDTFFKQTVIKYKLFFLFLSIFSFLAGILTFSRGSYIVLGISLLLYLFFKGYKKLALAIPIIVIVLGVFFTLFIPYGEGKNLLRTESTHARLVSAENALIIFSKNPIFGVGFNSYRYAQRRYHLLEGFNWEDTHSGAGVNNSFVFVLATTGILGGFTFAYFWFVILQKSWGNFKSKKTNSLFLFTSFIALLISGIFENTLFYPSIMVWMWILIGLID